MGSALDIWLPLGLHLGWNYFEGWVFGFSISGGRRLGTFVRQHDVGPALLTGGAYGPEGGLIGFGASILIAILVVAWLVFERRRRDRDTEERTGRGRKLAES